MARSTRPSPPSGAALRRDSGGLVVPIGEGDAIVRRGKREIHLLLAREEVTITHARYQAGERVAGPHVHHEHTDAFYVLEGELAFEIGREGETVTISAGGFVAVPPGVAHAFRTDGDRAARWLTIHARDGGFAGFMRGIRDCVGVRWDIAAVPADGGLAASEAVVSPAGRGGRPVGNRPCRLRCALPDLSVVEWHLHGPHSDPRPRHHGRGADTYLVLEGELELMLAEARQTVGPDTLITIPRGVLHTLGCRTGAFARMLSLHTPDAAPLTTSGCVTSRASAPHAEI
jgi:mannose-6-phosphate isomerase-like protein (cupin superfamily)